MKRIVCFLCILVLVMCVVGCKAKEEPKETTTLNEQGEAFRVKCGNGYLTIGMKASDFLALAGEAKNYTEIKSCAFDGLDKIYIYNGYEVVVNEIEGKEVVTRITFTDDSVQTKEGLYLGVSENSITNLYGKVAVNNNRYVYSYKNSKMAVGVKEGKVISVEIYYFN